MRNSNFNISWLQLVFVAVIMLQASCSPARRLADGEYLLNKSEINLKSKEIEKSELQSYQKQSPNKKILGFRFHLFLYNLAKPDKDKGISAWLKRIGEEPVIWNPVLTERSSDQFQRYLQAKGYYESEVSDTTIPHKGSKVTVSYTVKLNTPHRINQIQYYFEDQSIMPLIYGDTANCLIRVGARFDKEVLQKERQRLETLLKNNGYYNFTKEHIFFEADELPGSKKVNLEIIIKEYLKGIPDPQTKVRNHKQYKIHSTYIFPNYDLYARSEEEGSSQTDTVQQDKSYIIYSGKHMLRPEAVVLPNRCLPGNQYRLLDVQRSYNNYSSMGLFRLVNMSFTELNGEYSDTSEYKYLDCFIELSPRKPQSYQAEIVGTNTAGDIGARVNLLYNNHNIFRGAENLQIKFTGAIEQTDVRYSSLEGSLLREFGAESQLTLPKFLVPFKAYNFTRRYNPRTSFLASYNYQNRPGYVRVLGNTSLGYRWKGNAFTTYNLFPIDFNYVWLPEGITDENLKEDIEGSPLASSFENHTILASRLIYEYTNRPLDKETDYFYFRTNIESAGNMIHTVSKMLGRNDTAFLGVPYFRYLKGEIDYRIHDQITRSNKIVYRVFAGVGYPLGHSETLPFEKMYFGGGTNGIRAWGSYELGPGSDNTEYTSYANRSGDVKLEANLEYRFKLFWLLEGALFFDAGNIWTVNMINEGADFKWDRFYKEIAVGTGLGARFDFSFLLIRFDFGYKLRDPAILEGSRWIDLNDSYTGNRFNWNFGIGYPF